MIPSRFVLSNVRRMVARQTASSASGIFTTGQHCHRPQALMRRLYSQSLVSLAPPSGFSMSLLKELRGTSGAPIVECKKALEASAKDLDDNNKNDDDNHKELLQKALDWLRQHGAAKASSKVADRSSTEGLVGFFVNANDKNCCLVKVASETDFASRSDTFVSLVETVGASLSDSAAVGSRDNNYTLSQKELLAAKLEKP